jgi:hypothetical protein
MTSMSLNAQIDTSHPRPPHPFKVADSLTGIHSAMVKYLVVVNRSCTHEGPQVSPQVKLEDLNLGRVEAMKWFLLYLSIGNDRCY